MRSGVINILVSGEEVGAALLRALRHVLNVPPERVRLFAFREVEEKGVLARDVLEADFWIIEAYDYPHPLANPVGFRTAYHLAGRVSLILLFFILPSEDFPPEGPFWWGLTSSSNLIKKIQEVWGYIPEREEFERLIQRWPQLLKTFSSHS